jgi:thiaminase
MSKLGYFIPCIEYGLENLAKLRAIRIDERTLSRSHSFLSKINKILEDAKKNPSLAKALGSKEKAEKVADAILKWFEFTKDSMPSISHIIAHAFTISICLWVYESIGRYPSDAKFAIDVYVKRNEICRDVKSVGKLVDEVKALMSQVRSLIENISPRLLELESALQTIPSSHQ